MMARKTIFCALIFTLVSVKLFAQTSGCPQCPVNTLNSNLSPGDYKAREEVHAVPVTGAHVTGSQQIHLYVDPSIQLDADYQTSVNYTDASVNLPINTSLPVGAIPGQYGVNAVGQATYDIPIAVPPGTRNMVPSISINYNSSSSDGIAGRGWNITGVSVITRVAKSIYYDCDKEGISLTANDAFALDGERLIKTSGTDYRLEHDNFSLLTLINGNTGYFVVKTKDGLTKEFGNPNYSDSRLIVNGSVPFAWYLNKVTDNYGNYITYSYYNQNGEVALKEINYTGTVNFSPYNSIKFYYDKRINKSTRYFYGNELNNTLILREINISNENNFVRKYQFKYGFNTQSFLNEIIESGSDGSKLNSTLIKYGNDSAPGNDVSMVIPTKTAPTGDLMTSAEYRVGDFNGDGKSDLVAFEYNTIYSDGSRNYTGTWVLYLNTSSTNPMFHEYNLTSSAPLPSPFYPYPFRPYAAETSPSQVGFQTADFNLDGKADILIASTSGGWTTYTVYYSTGTGFTTNGGHPFTIHDYDRILLADIDGDGVPEGIDFSDASHFNWFHVWWFASGNDKFITVGNDINGSPITSFDYSGFNSIDYDGDGIQELYTSRPGEVVVIKLPGSCQNCSGEHAQEIYQESPGGYSENYFGDFNGDGITDVIKAPPPCPSGMCQHRFGTGTGFTTQATMNNTPEFDDHKSYIVCDINNDGKSDFLLMEASGNNITFGVRYGGEFSLTPTSLGTLNSVSFPWVLDYNIAAPTCIPYGLSFPNHNTFINDEPEFLTGDFDGDGRTDIFFKTSDNGKRAIAFINSESTQHLATKIVDGYRHTTKFSYRTLANDNSYVKGSGATYPLMDVQGPLYVVDNSSVNNGLIGGVKSYNYNYEKATVHLQGKGFLGFDKFTVIDNTFSTQTEKEFSLNVPGNTFYEKVPINTKTFLLPNVTNPIAEETYTNAFTTTAYVNNCSSTIPMAHFIDATQAVSHDYVSGKVVTKNFVFDSYNNMAQCTVQVNGVETSMTNSTYTSAGTWGNINNVPSSTLTTVTRGTEPQYVRRTDFTYDIAKGDLLQAKQDPLLTKWVATDNVYDQNTGLLVSKQVSASSLPSKNYSYEYDSKFRFITKDHNAFNQIAETQYDSRWGVPIYKKGIDGLIVAYTYDGFGQIHSITTPDNLTEYAQSEWVTSMSGNDPLNVATALFSITKSKAGSPTLKQWYDILGREIKIETDGFGNNKVYKVRQYDNAGNLWKESGPYQSISSFTPLITTYSYNNLNQLILKEVTDGNLTNTTSLDYTYSNGSMTVRTTAPDGNQSFKTTDPTELLISTSDNGGNISYNYGSNRQVKSVSVNSVLTSTMTYDSYGNQTSLWDKDAGTSQYAYDAYKKMVSQTDANNVTYNFSYDLLGRLTQKVCPLCSGETYNYSYVSSGNGLNLIDHINGPNNISYSYAYDQLNRIASYTENINNEIFTTSYEYDIYSNNSKIIMPGGFSLIREHDASGYLTKIKNGSTVLWQGDEATPFGSYSKYTLGNGIQTQVTYDNFTFPRHYYAPLKQDLNLDFDIASGNLVSRNDVIHGQTEDFLYDNLNRLTQSQVVGHSATTVSYNSDNGIASKSDAGTYSYVQPNIDAVKSVTNSSGNISSIQQNIIPTPFNKVQSISEGDNLLDITYGPDMQRKMTQLYFQGNPVYTRYFHPGYEKTIAGNDTRHVYYIYAPSGLCAMYTYENSTGTFHYIYSDHIGSILRVTDPAGDIEQNFDAWGRNRNPNDWTYNNVPASPSWLYRGFTQHEHLPQFALINMNGRVYDPLLGMMLSVDNRIQNPTSTQNFNRYTYVMNNPLSNVDPSGNSVLGILSDIWDVIFLPFRIINEGVNVLNQQVNGNSSYSYDVNYVMTGELPNSWRNDPNVILGSNGYPIGPYGEYNAYGGYGGFDIDNVTPISGVFTDASGHTYTSDQIMAASVWVKFYNSLPQGAQSALGMNAASFAYGILDGNITINYITPPTHKYPFLILKPTEKLLASAGGGGGGGGDDEGTNRPSYMQIANIIALTLAADDASGIGFIDDVLIPVIYGTAFILDLGDNTNLKPGEIPVGKLRPIGNDEMEKLQRKGFDPHDYKPSQGSGGKIDFHVDTPGWIFWKQAGSDVANPIYLNMWEILRF